MTGDRLDFADLVAKARFGDPEDLQLAVSQFEPHLKRAIRRRRRKQREQTRPFCETKNCLQSVIVVFYTKVADQQLEITSFKSLKRLLLKMIRDKLTDHERQGNAAKQRRYSDSFYAPVDTDTPSTIVSRKEELESLSDGLSETDSRILELSREGRTSVEISSLIENHSRRSIRRFLERLKRRFLDKTQGNQ